jgi:hypothetical protein
MDAHPPALHHCERATVIRAVTIWLAASALGVCLLILLPESLFGGAPVFSLSERHGPSPSDATGLVLIAGGWMVFLRALWVGWPRRKAARLPGFLAVVAAAASIACIAAITDDRDGLALALGLAAFAAQLALAVVVHCLAQPERE